VIQVVMPLELGLTVFVDLVWRTEDDLADLVLAMMGLW
jgi:hypothetical protein